MDISTVVLIAFNLVILLYAIILHEIAHGLAALAMGDRTAKNAGRLTLNPVPHIDPFGSIVVPLIILIMSGFRFAFGWARPVPYNPRNLPNPRWDGVKVALAGPMMNFALAMVAALLMRGIPLDPMEKSQIFSAVLSADWEFLGQLTHGSFAAIAMILCMMTVFWNTLLGVFNLLPIPPLDGSAILSALVHIPPSVRIMMEQYGFLVLLLIVIVFPQVINIPLSAVLRTVYGIAIGG